MSGGSAVKFDHRRSIPTKTKLGSDETLFTVKYSKYFKGGKCKTGWEKKSKLLWHHSTHRYLCTRSLSMQGDKTGKVWGSRGEEGGKTAKYAH